MPFPHQLARRTRRLWWRLVPPPPFRLSQAPGPRSEQLAERHLRRAGLRIVARNVRHPIGEIDILALDGPTLVIVEVKGRCSDRAGLPEEAVGATKASRLVRLARLEAAQRGHEGPIRIDVVGVDLGPAPTLRWHPNAVVDDR